MILKQGNRTCTLLLNAGHNEYGISEARVVWDTYDDVKEVDLEKILAAPHHHLLWYDEDLKEWGTLVEVKATRGKLEYLFNQLADDLRVPPGGDDSAFDYWPSGMRMLWEMAIDLAELYNQDRPEFLQTYYTVVDDVLAAELKGYGLDQLELVATEWSGLPMVPEKAISLLVATLKANNVTIEVDKEARPVRDGIGKLEQEAIKELKPRLNKLAPKED